MENKLKGVIDIQGLHCPSVLNIRNGQSFLSKSNLGDVVTYECNENYILLGTAMQQCLPNGTWSGHVPECISIDPSSFYYFKNICASSLFASIGVLKCARLTSPLNTNLIYGNEHGPIHNAQQMFPIGTLVEFECINGLVLLGESPLTCVDGGIWDLPMPKCVIHSTVPATTTTTKPSTTSITPTSTIIATTNEHAIHFTTISENPPSVRSDSTFLYSPRTAANSQTPNKSRILAIIQPITSTACDENVPLPRNTTTTTDNNSTDSTRASINTTLHSESNSYGCLLESLPESHPNTFISEVILDNKTIVEVPDRIFLKGLVHVRSRVYYSCVAGFQHKGRQEHYAECNDDFSWTPHRSTCEGGYYLLI